MWPILDWCWMTCLMSMRRCSRAVNTEMKRSPITAKKTQTKAIKSLSMGSSCFLTSTSDRFTSSLEPLLGNWIAKESYLGGKSSQFLIDLNSILLLLCHSRREQFTIDRLQSSSKKSAKFSTHNFQLFLMTFYLNLSPL